MRALLFVFFALVSLSVNAQTTNNTFQFVYVDGDTINLTELEKVGRIELLPSKGSRVIVETYTNISDADEKTQSIVAQACAPDFDVNTSTFKAKQATVNGIQVIPLYKIYLPAHIRARTSKGE